MAPEPITPERLAEFRAEWARLEAEAAMAEAKERVDAILGRYRVVNPPGANRAERRKRR